MIITERFWHSSSSLYWICVYFVMLFTLPSTLGPPSKTSFLYQHQASLNAFPHSIISSSFDPAHKTKNDLQEKGWGKVDAFNLLHCIVSITADPEYHCWPWNRENTEKQRTEQTENNPKKPFTCSHQIQFNDLSSWFLRNGTSRSSLFFFYGESRNLLITAVLVQTCATFSN